MTEFVRVRSARPGDPLHEFDVPTLWIKRFPGRYEVLDAEPVDRVRPASHIPGTVPMVTVRRRSKRAKKRALEFGEPVHARVSEDLPLRGANPQGEEQ